MDGAASGAQSAVVEGNAVVGGKLKRSWKFDALGLAWVIAAGLAPLIPALVHGAYLGPYDILSKLGLTSIPGASVHNFSQRDLIAQFIPFTEQAWTQVHHGHLPLWNPQGGLGMPLAFEWQSAPFGLPQLIGYLAPIHLAFTVGVLVTVVVAGSGTYVFGRVLRLGVLASALVGTVFVLSGPIFSFLGWPSTSVTSWAGWIFAVAVLVIRGRRRLLCVFGLAVTIAMSIYAGHPESTALLLMGLFLFVAVLLAQLLLRRGGWNRVVHPVFDLVVGTVAGAALSAPLLLPGMQIISLSTRASGGNYASVTIPDHALLQLIFQGFDGLPISGSHWFATGTSYEWTADYFGVIALALAVVAIGTRWRRPEVLGMVMVVVVMGALALLSSVASLINHLPLVGNVLLNYATEPLALAVAVLAGIGLDALVRDHAEPGVRQWAGASFGISALALLAVWTFGRGHLPSSEASIRAASFVWPAIAALTGLVSVGWLAYVLRRNHGRPQMWVARTVAGILLVCETAFLVTAAAPLWTSLPNPLRTTPAVASLQRTVGSSLVGLGSSMCVESTWFGTSEPGILPNANLVFHVHELAIYDALIPKAYYSSWLKLTGSEGGSPYLTQFCPAVTSVAAARVFGVKYVLEPLHSTGPTGASFIGRYGDEALYQIPGSALATLVPARIDAPLPPISSPGRPVTVHTPNPSTWQLVTNAHQPQVLRFRLTNVPGWRATIDGRPLQLQIYSGVMLQAGIPPGRHVIVLQYWPKSFTVGLVLAALTIAGLVIALLYGWVRRRPPKTSLAGCRPS